MVAILGFSKEQITAAVQAMYSEVAAAPTHPFHFPVGRAACSALGYPEAEIERLPAAVVESFAGVGYPFRAGVIGPGDRVLDIGAGSGTDTLIASRLVGDGGKVWALDITPAMLGKLRATLQSAGVRNVAVIEGDAERIPLPDDSVDVVTSNGVLNLVPHKQRAFAEIFRVLRPGGRVQIADVVIARPVPIGGRRDPRLWAECVVGASVDEDYLDLFRAVGFADVSVLRGFDYFSNSRSAETRHIAKSLGARAIEISMRRPAEASAGLRRLAYRLHPRRLKGLGGRGLWGAAATVAALVTCYGTLGLLALLSLLGIAVTVDTGLWAGAIVGAAGLAAVGTAFNARRHRRPWPLALAAAGAAAIAYVMFGAHDPLIEGLAFAALVGAVVFDLYLLYRADLCP
jgi:SAM-dependent methyltransferase